MKSWKTTLVGVTMLVAFCAILYSYLTGKIDSEKFGVATGSIAAVGTSLIGILGKDASASHTKK